MAQSDHTPPTVCSNCDGFAAVHITLGGRDRSGARRTITAHCSVCHGTGTPRRRNARLEVRA
ncbi:hypothetical protein [Streptomyces sp. LN699]|uniref:hypothetical protein n=1 Tax=Streptomyces sp. LN699 TaxID=3112981 RepID=UPI003715EFA9